MDISVILTTLPLVSQELLQYEEAVHIRLSAGLVMIELISERVFYVLNGAVGIR